MPTVCREGHGGSLLDISLCGGFALADSAKRGFSVVVTAGQGERALAERVAREVAFEVWAERRAFLTPLTPLADAVALAVLAGQGQGERPILADVADNPGGGGGNNTLLLRQWPPARAGRCRACSPILRWRARPIHSASARASRHA